MKIFQYGGRHRAIGTMWLTMWPVTLPTEANENTRVARGTLSAITVGSSNLCTGPKFRAAAPNIVADQNFSVVLDLLYARYRPCRGSPKNFWRVCVAPVSNWIRLMMATGPAVASHSLTPVSACAYVYTKGFEKAPHDITRAMRWVQDNHQSSDHC